jgi:hypothetical protein
MSTVPRCAAARAQREAAREEVALPDGGMKKGPRSVQNVVTNMETIVPRLRYLYAEMRVGKPELEGTIHMMLDVDWKGNVTYVSVWKSTMKNLTFEDLLEATLSNHRFDVWREGKEKTEIIYPIEFRKKHAESAPRSRSRRKWERERARKATEAEKDTTGKTDTAGDTLWWPEEQ